MGSLNTPAALPEFKVRICRPDISPWVAGNTGITGVTTLESGCPGPHVALFSLMHGNELAGAIVLDRLLRAGLTPTKGKLSFGFLNLTAFDRFDPQRPTASRFIDEDMNRVWDETILQGPRHSIELDRAREIRSFVDTIDVLLDLHSMLWPSEALILSGAPAKGRSLAQAIGTPPLVVADHGHVNGRRLIDFPRFSSPETPYAACLVEAGQHWEQITIDTIAACVACLLRHLGIVGSDAPLPPAPAPAVARTATVTTAVTAMTSSFAFVQTYRGGDIIPRRNTLIAMDGDTEIRTPHDNCLLVMPSLRPSRGHTAVRLGRFE
ncbi:succinylglutamate desuccinylase/aspartoacylase family protein [Acidisphaera sp. S103]|uniref:succinylglutamate desuccinylase/aspartoacylase domain-containing protein n=1 Tax=Acidisphaera sp. S103 TaxID=1747223 RepID=UPI00131BDD12|nr:succinylglutamate desuccinylase/aspartoacylase family protein [Acidisphaera sp. S103]